MSVDHGNVLELIVLLSKYDIHLKDYLKDCIDTCKMLHEKLHEKLLKSVNPEALC